MRINFNPTVYSYSKNIKKANALSPKVTNVQKTNYASLPSNIASYGANISFGRLIEIKNNTPDDLKDEIFKEVNKVNNPSRRDYIPPSDVMRLLEGGLYVLFTVMLCENEVKLKIAEREAADAAKAVESDSLEGILGTNYEYYCTSAYHASKNELSEIMQKLCDFYKDKEKLRKDLQQPADKHGRNAIHNAAENSNSNVMQIICDTFEDKRELKAALQKPGNEYGDTPIFMAASNRNPEVMQIICNVFENKRELVKALLAENKVGLNTIGNAILTENIEVLEVIRKALQDNKQTQKLSTQHKIK